LLHRTLSIRIPDERRPIAPAADHLGGDPFAEVPGVELGHPAIAGQSPRGGGEKFVEGGDVLVELAHDQIRTVEPEVVAAGGR
jgi:hypothetical protein